MKIKEGLIFSITAGIVFILIGTIYASLTEVEPGNTLTAQKWNEIIGEIEALKNQNSTLNSAIPQGATIAFNSSTCPSGWSIANDLKDKFIIGAGNSYSVGATGGTATTTGTVGGTTLTISQIPSHNHSQGTSPYYSQALSGGGDNSLVNVLTSSSTTGNAGGGQAHTHTFTGGNNLPPFVAYIYCTKD